ncbi:MAG TPA: hypothetical protein VF177_13020 [Anaerolineae bacterium]
MTVAVFLLMAAVGIVLLLGWSIGLGWLLTRLIPVFTLFEASLLVMFASIAIAHLGSRLTVPMPDNEVEEELEDEEESPIPAGRFYKSEAEKTGEALLRYRLANSIYLDLDEQPRTTGMMSESQLEELAIRLTDIAVAILKRKSKPAGRIAVTIPALVREMEKRGQRPYDDDILKVAVASINEQLFFDLDLLEVVREKGWDKPVPDWFSS